MSHQAAPDILPDYHTRMRELAYAEVGKLSAEGISLIVEMSDLLATVCGITHSERLPPLALLDKSEVTP